MGRRVKWIIGVVLALPLLAAAALIVALPRIDLAAMASARATASLGRSLTIESLRVTPGRSIAIVVRGVRLDNIEGGSAPAMMELATAEAEIDLAALLRGTVLVRRLHADGFTLLLERAADRRANWHFGPRPATPPAPEPPARDLPTILDFRMTGSEVVFRTTSGARLTTRLDTASFGAADAAAPVTLRAEGSYNAVPVVLEGGLGSFAQLHDAATPFPMTLRATARDTAMLFEGTGTDPLNFDGLDGRLTLAASNPHAILAMAGAGANAGPDVPVDLAGHFTRQGDLWRLRDATGTLDGSDVRAALLELAEGSAGSPDRIVARVHVASLDVNRLLGPDDGAQGRGDADIPLVVPQRPDPLFDIEASTRELTYARLRGTDAHARLEVAPGRMTLHEARVTAFGARMAGSAELLPAPRGARVRADITLREGDIDTLRRAFGLRALPVAGRISADIVAGGEAASVNAVTREARISAVVSMTGGTIAREVIEMASTDVRALFRTSQGTTPISCLLAAVDINAGAGRAAPLRIRAGTGTISGLATFDLNRQTLDLIIGSQSDTTDFFALDIPVQVRGSFDNPSIAPADWSRAARERMARNEMAPLPANLRTIAQRNPCYRGQGPGR
ncbi:AsmA family protein [Roseomonas fluvialis]|uniref:AsmA-like C-terminal domain-containing protein n=1 Tax=Roseomonas fluvialis TaxID=1750527 RepID=A0ABM7XZ94_9PROT|nr:AsmA-like C-terminal region-containing protein [Roseomonas fluvialis]BDG70829.1 hypothetical protein Rmf_07580 [Roseomonas fluvialis]